MEQNINNYRKTLYGTDCRITMLDKSSSNYLLEKKSSIDNWGVHIVPVQARDSSQSKLPVIIFCAYSYGYLALKQLIRLLEENLITIALVVTDDPTALGAKINQSKRLWQSYSSEMQKKHVDDILKLALMHKIPVYTGKVKTDFFMKMYNKINPSLAVVAGFGQIFHEEIFAVPKYGMFNFHPGTDLNKNEYRGVDPFSAMIENNDKFSYMNIHYITDVPDGGLVVGKSIPINISFFSQPDDSFDIKLLIYNKISLSTPYMLRELLFSILQKHFAKDTNIIKSVETNTVDCELTQEILTSLILENKANTIRPSENVLFDSLIKDLRL